MGASRTVKGIEDHLERLRREEDNSIYAWSVSFADIVNHPLYQTWLQTEGVSKESTIIEGNINDEHISMNYKKPSKRYLRAILHVLGMDIKEPFEAQYNQHRAFNGDIYNTLRYVGKRRTDDVWQNLVMSKVKGVC